MKKLLTVVGMLLLPIQAQGASVAVTPSSSTVLPGAVRSVYSNVQGDANLAVTWSATGGSVEASPGYAVWTAPQTPGTYTVTATSVADPAASAASSFTVIGTATVRLSNIPAQATVFKGQPLVIQSILWGSTETGVNWTASGGTLTGTGRETVFKADAAGSYTVTATSVADPAKSFTTTVAVTDNPWPGAATANKTMPVDCTPTGSGRTFEVRSEAEMDAVPWPTLGPGDTVRIHPGTYHRQILLSSS